MPLHDSLDFLRRFQSKRIAIAAHQRPDGDAAGSALGLADLLCVLGGKARFVTPSPLPYYLLHLQRDDLIAYASTEDWWRDYDCLCIVDCGEIGRLDEIIQPAANHLPTCTIDHHASSAGVGEARWLAPSASSVGEMCVQLATAADWPLTPFAAQAFWTAIVTDTGRFSFENATADALEAASLCVRAGASPSGVAEWLYQSVSIAERKLQTFVLERMELSENGRLATSWLSRDDFTKAACGTEETQNLINLLRDTKGVEVAVFFYEPPISRHPHEVKVSFRTKAPFDALKVTTLFQGGGHQRAAGCSLYIPLLEARKNVLEVTRREYFLDA